MFSRFLRPCLLQAKKEALLQEIFNFLAMSLGLPPRKFDFAYRDKDGNYHSEADLTPQAFYQKYVDLKLDDYVSIINAPTADKPYGKSYTVEMLGNVVGSKPVRYLNVEMKRLKELAIAQMQAGETVWFGSDVGQSSNRKAGIMEEGMHDLTASMDILLTQDKAGRLDYSESLMTQLAPCSMASAARWTSVTKFPPQVPIGQKLTENLPVPRAGTGSHT